MIQDSKKLRLVFSKRYRNDEMEKFVIEISFGKDPEEPIIQLKRTKEKANIITITTFKTRTIMAQANAETMDQWIHQEFTFLLKLTHEENYDSICWNNK